MGVSMGHGCHTCSSPNSCECVLDNTEQELEYTLLWQQLRQRVRDSFAAKPDHDLQYFYEKLAWRHQVPRQNEIAALQHSVKQMERENEALHQLINILNREVALLREAR